MPIQSAPAVTDDPSAALRRFRAALGQSISLGELAGAALDCLRGVSAGVRAAVLLVDEGGAPHIAASVGLSEAARELTLRHASRVLASPSSSAGAEPSLRLSDVEVDDEGWDAQDALSSQGIRTVAFAPCGLGERPLGAIVMCLESADAFERHAPPLLETLAAEFGLVIEQRRLPVSQERLAEAPPSSAYGRDRTQLLAALSDVLASSLDPDTTLQKLASFVVPALADYAITYACEGQLIRRLGCTHRDPARMPLLESLLASGDPSRDDRHGPGAVIRSGTPVLARQVTAEMIARASQNPQHQAAVLALGPRSSMVVPLESRGRVIGAMSFSATAESGRQYDDDDLRFACVLGQRVALLVDNARLYREAREAIRMRDDILAVVSHDLRNPLNTIAVASSLLDLQPNPEVFSKAQRSIARAAKQMERLLADLLDVSRAESGGLALKLAPVDIAGLIDEAYALALPQAEDKSVRLERRVAVDLGDIDGDRDRLLQVLNNLIGNAIKFVPSGGTVTIGAQDLYGQIRIWISDNGPGIAADHVPRVFDRFWQANRQGARGAGLGLTIAKSIVDAHGGQIGVHSNEGEGSTFFAWLPCSPKTVRSPTESSTLRHDGLRDSDVPTPPAG